MFGLISAFEAVNAAEAIERQAELSAGISEAMYTTAMGIAVAVPLLFFHHFLQRRSEEILIDVEHGATAIVVALSGEVDEPGGGDPAPQPTPVPA
ncbi:MAG: hypothetical protein CSA66_08215 [Proteobacteria bacterium]|nr:MAG: hypothetical protein CSA66_08215 [Pseudomonadota bacterium]